MKGEGERDRKRQKHEIMCKIQKKIGTETIYIAFIAIEQMPKLSELINLEEKGYLSDESPRNTG